MRRRPKPDSIVVQRAEEAPCAALAAAASRERDRQSHRAIDADRWFPHRVGTDARTAQARGERGQRLLQLSARQRGAEAMMRAMAKCNVWHLTIVSGGDVLGLREGGLIVVGAPDGEKYLRTRFQPLAVAFDRLGDAATHSGRRGAIAPHFFDDIGHVEVGRRPPIPKPTTLT